MCFSPLSQPRSGDSMKRAIRSNAGVTLLELMVAMGILTAVMGVLFTLSLSIGDTARLQNTKVINNDEARRVLLAVIPRLRMAQDSTINKAAMPGDVLSFRMPSDLDGNGTSVNVGGDLELGNVVTFRRDSEDLNGDGVSTTQLIMVEGDTITVLANNLSPDAAPAPAAEGEPEPENTAGFWVQEQSGGVLVTIRTQGTSRRGHVIRQTFTELVDPRN
jgi:hypothetical protein